MVDSENEEISLENIEALIAELGDDPVFDTSLMDSIGSSSTARKFDEGKAIGQDTSGPEQHRQRFKRLGVLSGPLGWLSFTFEEFLFFLGKLERLSVAALKRWLQSLRSAPRWIQRPSIDFLNKLNQFGRRSFTEIGRGYDRFIGLVVNFDLVRFLKMTLILSIPVTFWMIFVYFFHPWIWSSPIVQNLSVVTGSAVLGLKEDRVVWDALLSPAPFAAHEYQFPKMVLNLKDGRAGFELTVHLSNAEAVAELKGATSFFVDRIQTDFLSVSSEELSSPNELDPIREKIRATINADLKRGEVIKVLYSLFLLRS